MGEAITKVYQSTQSETYAAAQRAIRDLGFKVDRLDKANGLLTFKTGLSWKSWAGQEMSVMLIELADRETEVSVSGKRNQSGVIIQLYDWGEVEGIATKVLMAMDDYLGVKLPDSLDGAPRGLFDVSEKNMDPGD
jgi:hypothetical protein